MDRAVPKGKKTKPRRDRASGRYDWSRPLAEVLDDLAPPRAEGRRTHSPDPTPPAGPAEGFSLAEQIDCVTREVALRENSYPKQIAAGRLTEPEAARKIARMRAVLDTLVNLQRMIRSIPHQDQS